MRAVKIFAWVVLLVAIASADAEEEEEVTIYLSEEAQIIYHAFGEAAQQCSEDGGHCVEDGNPCNGTFKIIHNSCNDLCPCCITTDRDQCATDLSIGAPTKVAEGPKGCPDGFFMIDGSQQCFKFFNDEDRSWKQAKSKCEEEGLRLAEPESEIAIELRKYVLDTYGDGGAWLGARGDGSDYVWEENDTTLTSYSLLLRPGLEGTDILRSHCLGLFVTKGAWNKYPERPYGSRACSRDYYTLCEDTDPGKPKKKRVGGSQSSRQSRLQ